MSLGRMSAHGAGNGWHGGERYMLVVHDMSYDHSLV